MCSTLLIKLSGSNQNSTQLSVHTFLYHISSCVCYFLSLSSSLCPTWWYYCIPTSFSVQWETVPCIQRNGDITGYSVRYGVLGNGGMETLTMVVPDILMTNLTGLVPATSYLVQVAGVNGQGVGVYGEITVTTPLS